MWIVELALKKPYTYTVLAVLIMIFGIVSIVRTPVDIFPDIDIPVISVIWTYKGLSAEEFEKRITIYSEYALAANVNDIKKIESQTIDGVGVIKLFFHPNVDVSSALSQATATSQSILTRMPVGVRPPIILRYTAASVPIIQMSLSSKNLSESVLYDYGIYRVRQALGVVQGTTLPAPYGGKVRQIMVDLDPLALQTKGLSARDVNQAINAQNLTLPTGKAKIGNYDYRVSLNNSPKVVEAIGDIPVKVVNGKVVFIRDLAHVRDGFEVQQNIVRTNGSRSTLLTILKNGSVSTLKIVDEIKNLVPTLQAAAPKGLKIDLLFDQSKFVRTSIENVLHEGLIAACLTGGLILLFLGSWRSTLIVLISIPLSILSSIIMLSVLGETLNIMTLGGLALAIGILVDDATVEIENIHRNIDMGKDIRTAILDGAQQIAAPIFVSSLSICIVFVSVLLLEGPARYLFVPFALAVVFAVMSSYMLSRTVIPVLVNFLVPGELEEKKSGKSNIVDNLHKAFMSLFDKLSLLYSKLLESALKGSRNTIIAGLLVVSSSLLLVPFIGRDFFPTVDAGQMRLHVVAPSGTRIEKTEEIFSGVEEEVRKLIPPEEIELITDNIGVNSVSFNLAFGDNATVSSADGEILIALSHHRTKSSVEYQSIIRRTLEEKFPELDFYFQPADIVSQILNFGLPSPVNIRVSGYNRVGNLEIAKEIVEKVKAIPGAVDVHLHQVVDAPQLELEVDRTKAAKLGLTQSDVANDVLVSLSSNTQITPNYWVDPEKGIPYLLAVQTPKYKVESIDSVLRTPISSNQTKDAQLLGNVATVGRGKTVAVVSHYNIQPVYDIYANVENRDLGGFSEDVRKVIEPLQKKMAPGNQIFLRGLVESMDEAFLDLGMGFVAAIVIVYLLLVVNFQSWLKPFIIIMSLPGAIAGIAWMLFLSMTTFNVPSLMGAIMSVGVATANSVLMVTFASDQLKEGKSSFEAALNAGKARLRPVLMTAAAMIVGMIPMALGLGEGGEQNAPLGRAVIGGLAMATLFTLFFVPTVFSVIEGRKESSVSS